jgi:hypothetical protein
MKLNRYIFFFTIGIINGAILNLVDYSFWLEVGIASIMAIIVMIIFRNKFLF